jgi:hypothetical protein
VGAVDAAAYSGRVSGSAVDGVGVLRGSMGTSESASSCCGTLICASEAVSSCGCFSFFLFCFLRRRRGFLLAVTVGVADRSRVVVVFAGAAARVVGRCGVCGDLSS